MPAVVPLVTPETGVQALQQVREAFLGAGCGKGTPGCAGGKDFNLDFLPSKGLLGQIKPNKATERLW